MLFIQYTFASVRALICGATVTENAEVTMMEGVKSSSYTDHELALLAIVLLILFHLLFIVYATYHSCNPAIYRSLCRRKIHGHTCCHYYYKLLLFIIIIHS